jgi:hypothetical protein
MEESKIKSIVFMIIAALLALPAGLSMNAEEYDAGSQVGTAGPFDDGGITGVIDDGSTLGNGFIPYDDLSVPGNAEDAPFIDPQYPQSYPQSDPGSAQSPAAGETAFFTAEEPDNSGQLMDAGVVSESSGSQILQSVPSGNGLWIADGAGEDRLTTLNVPESSWANQEIIPSMEGDLTLHYKHPSGKVVSKHLGYVKPYHRYWYWFYGDFPGTYEVWYTIGGTYYSNRIWYYVQNDWPWWYGGYTYRSYYGYPWFYSPVVYQPITYRTYYTTRSYDSFQLMHSEPIYYGVPGHGGHPGDGGKPGPRGNPGPGGEPGQGGHPGNH